MNKKNKIPERLSELLAERNISKWELGKSTGLSNSLIGRWEKGRIQPTADSIIALCEFFGCSADFLLGLKDE